MSAQGGQAVVEGMGDGKTAVVGAYAGEVDVGFDDGVQSRCDYVVFTGCFGGRAVFLQRLIAKAVIPPFSRLGASVRSQALASK